MRKRRMLLVLLIPLVCAIIFAALFWRIRCGEEPAYAEHPLSYWLRIVVLSSAPSGSSDWVGAIEKRQLALEAIHAIGTNAIPTLLEWTNYESTRPKARLINLLARLRQTRIGSYLPQSLTQDPNSYRAYVLAPVGFATLGSQSVPAIPELLRRARNPRAGDRAQLATEVLAWLGSDGLASLSDVLSDPAAPTRVQAARLIGTRFGSNATPVLPTLIKCLRDPDAEVAVAASVALAGLRLDPTNTVRACIKALEDPRPMVRLQIVNLIATYEDEASEALPVLNNYLHDLDPKVREATSNALKIIAP